MATKKYPAPTNGIVMSPKGVAPGVGVLYVNGVPTKFVALKTPLAPGWGVEYQGGKAVRFVSPTSGAAAPPPAAPATPAARTFAPEMDPVYNATELAARKQRDVTLAGLAQQRSSGLGDYGFKEGSYDPAAASYGALTFDPNNPFSKASLLKRTYDQNRAGRGLQQASAGQLYAGSYQTSQDAINRNQLQSEDALQKSLARFLAQNTQRYGQAGVDYTGTVGQSAAEAAARFAANPPS